MKQLPLPIETTAQRALTQARSLMDYVRKHPSDLLLAVIAVILMDIESDLDQLES